MQSPLALVTELMSLSLLSGNALAVALVGLAFMKLVFSAVAAHPKTYVESNAVADILKTHHMPEYLKALSEYRYAIFLLSLKRGDDVGTASNMTSVLLELRFSPLFPDCAVEAFERVWNNPKDAVSFDDLMNALVLSPQSEE